MTWKRLHGLKYKHFFTADGWSLCKKWFTFNPAEKSHDQSTAEKCQICKERAEE